ncbi:MAG: hypothetical protein ACLQVG_04125 [Terriglobia bacterium]
MKNPLVSLFLRPQAFFLFLFLCFIASPYGICAATAFPCAGSLNVSRFRLMIQPAKGGTPLPLQDMNIIEAGEKVKYEPLHIPPAIRDRARIALMVVAAPKPKSADAAKGKADAGKEGDDEKEESTKEEKKEAKQDIHVLESLPAKDPQEWEIPARASVVGVVFGPHGLDVKKVSAMVIKNPDLIPELTEYAEETAKVGALVETLTEYEQQPDPTRDVNAALAGFGTDYNVAVPKIDTTQPTNQQAAMLMQAMMPSLQTFDPITASPTGMVAQSAGLAGAVTSMFFGSPVGLAAGGAALFLNMRTLVFPGTDFRSAFTQPFQTTGLALCAKNEPDKPRTRVAYLWMMKVPDAEAPAVALPETEYLPIGSKCTIKVPFKKPAECKLLGRAHGWELVSDKAHADVPVKVQSGTPDDSLDLDLTQTKLPPGEYHLAALWDWAPLQVKGDVDLRPLGDITKAKVAADSADHLLEGAGVVKTELTGTDFEFVNKVAMAKADDKKATPKEMTFNLPTGEAKGDQENMEVDVDTSAWAEGSYRLILTQTNGSTHDVALVIHPPNPTIDDLPLRANLGETQQTVILRGTRLERITHIISPHAAWDLAPVKSDAHDLKDRKATVKLQAEAHRGELLAATVSVENIQTPVLFSQALQVAGPRPKIAGVSMSLAQQPDVILSEGEIPAGAPVSFSLLIHNSDAHPTLSLICTNDGFLKTPVVLHPGDRTAGAQLDFAGEDGLFLSVDPGVVGQSGCQLAAIITTESAGSSDPTTLGRLIRLPRIEKFALTDDKLESTLYSGILTGIDLQIIEKTGWDGKTGYPVQGIPTPVPGSNTQEQTLKVELPWPPPSPHAPIYVWLRGETTGRLTDVKY